MNNEKKGGLELSAPNSFELFAAKNGFQKRIAESAQILGIALQEKISEKGSFNREDVETLLRQKDPENSSKGVWERDILSLLVKTWKYGEDLGFAFHFDAENVFWERYACSQFEKMMNTKKKSSQSFFSKVFDLFRGSRQRE